MQLEHSFSVPVGIDEAWKILLDIERIGPCMPGAVIDSVDGDDFTGTVKVKLGPINLSYKGKASFVEKDEAARRAVIDARGRDARGNGTAAAKVTATLTEDGGNTTVLVNTDLDITGKPAQFGRGVMVDVGNKLLGQFANALAATIKGDGGDEATGTAPEPVAAEPAAVEPVPVEPAAEGAAAEPAVTDAAERARPRPSRGEAPSAESAGPEPTAAASSSDKEPAEEGTPTVAIPQQTEVGSVNGHRGVMHADDVEPIDLLKSAGPAIGKRLAGPAAVALVIALIAIRRRQRR